MTIGLIGLGRMGAAIAQRLVHGNFKVVGFDRDKNSCQRAREVGVNCVESIAEVAAQSRVMWLMVPAGEIVDAVLKDLMPHLKAGDIIVDGGNSKFTDSMRRAQMLKDAGIFYLDCGTSGGLLGREIGFCLMVGGEKKAYEKIHAALTAIAAPGGVAHVGPSGAGHYVKMVHNGVEYGILQAYGEGFHLIKEGTFKDKALDLQEIARVWTNGSVVRSWLLDLAHEVFQEDQELADVSGYVAEGGTGRWTVEDAHKNNIPVPVIERSLAVRRESRDTGGTYATKVVAMLRKKFGGHDVKKVNDENN